MTLEATDVRGDLIAAYLAHWRMLRKALIRRVRSVEIAEDALQETWIRLDGMQKGGDTILDRQAYILRIAGNIAIDLQRRERRHTGNHISDEDLLNSLIDAMPSPETVVIDRQHLAQLALALSQLPAKARTALLLSRCDGMSHADIAARLRVSPSMVAKYLAQSLRHCRDHFRTIV